MNTDPRDTISNSPMSWLQIIAVAITVGLNALDGFDVLSISFASPGIAAEWGIDRAALGIVLSMELIGMALGSIFLGRRGRQDRTQADGARLPGADVRRHVHGHEREGTRRSFGVADHYGCRHRWHARRHQRGGRGISNLKRRYMCVPSWPLATRSARSSGAPSSRASVGHDWRSVFYFGAGITAAFIPLVYWLVPESVHWLTRKQPAGALDKINRILERFGRSAP